MHRELSRAVALVALVPVVLAGQAAPQPRDTIVTVPTRAPRVALPSEAASARIRKFSFIAYGDTRGRKDGIELQAEHGMVVASMLETIKRLAAAKDPIRFVLQSGDAVVNGSLASQLNVSYIPLVDRLTQEGGVPYFLSVGNHDVGNASSPTDPRRIDGLHNYFAANAKLIPPDGSPRRLPGYAAYAFGYGNSFFLAFDSTIPDDTVQFAWVRSQLARLDRKRYVNVVLFFHHPAWSSGPHGGPRLEATGASIRSRWMPLFRKYHVRLLLTGHEHLYEHWVEHYRDASGPHRIDQIVSGGGGAPTYSYAGEPDLKEYLAAGAAEHVAVEHLVRPAADVAGNPYHYVVVHVDGERLSIEVIAADRTREFAPYRSNAVSLGDPKP